MKVVFCGVFYYQGNVRNLYTIFQIYNAIGKIFKTIGIEVYYFSKQNEILPNEETLTEEQFYAMLPEIDLLFMWNGSLGKEIEIAEKCKAQGTPVYFMELGWLPQTNTFYFDMEGVNFNSSITRWQPKGMTDEERKESAIKVANYHKNIAKITGLELEKEFVFVPLQVEGDSQIIKYSPRIKKMQQLIDYCVAHIQDKIIFKTHPKDDCGELKFPERCKVLKCGTTHDYLRQCKYVVTINSTVGVEALTYNLPIINLGQSFYGGKGLTYEVKNDVEMKNGVAWANENKVAVGRIAEFLGYLFKRQWHKGGLENPEKVLGLIENIIAEKGVI